MIPKIAIQGHPTRGKEVIQILESLGGINSSNLLGNNNSSYYYIRDNNTIMNMHYNTNYKTYILEEFEKEFPFKIGDKVLIKGCILLREIIKLEYYCNQLCYKLSNGLHYEVYDLEPYKKIEEMEERNITLTLIKAKEWYKKGGELKEVALQAYSKEELIKIELPKTWEEFCDNYPVKEDEAMISSDGHVINCKGIEGKRNYDFKDIMPSKKSAEAHLALVQLEQLRDCYRQGDIPDFNNNDVKYCIIKNKNCIYVGVSSSINRFLSFTKREVAEEFFINFKPLIKLAEDYI